MRMATSFLIGLVGGLVLAVLIQAQDQSGFISLDCGAPAGTSYTDTMTTINYTSDANFINGGVSRSIESELKTEFQRQMWNLRSFPEGTRNCYNISITKGSKYLIAATFLYGNYDGLNKLPQFDILLGANRWDTITIDNATIDQSTEILHVPSHDYIDICLVNTGSGTPFISVIELRPLRNDIYVTRFGSLETYVRLDLGSNITYRYPYDVYDRFWWNGDSTAWTQLKNVSFPTNSLEQYPNSDYKPPPIVMSTAVTPSNASDPLIISWEPINDTDQFYVYMYFVEIQELAMNQTREFTININGERWYEGNIVPDKHKLTIIYSTSGISGKEIKFSFEKTENSTLPPIINAIEIYKVIDFLQ